MSAVVLRLTPSFMSRHFVNINQTHVESMNETKNHTFLPELICRDVREIHIK